jgi:hypothetical protein
MYLHPNIMLWSKWDIKLVIRDAYHDLGWIFAFEHVKSHQDNSIPVENLPLEVQLNAEADHLATSYLANSKHQGRVSLFMSAKGQLLINGATMSHKLQNATKQG